MTYPATDRGPSVPAGGTDDSNAVGPMIQADGFSVPRAAFHSGSGYVAHRDKGPEASSIPLRDTDGDDGLPDVPRYEGPTVGDQPALVNPSAGNQGPAGGGVNPQGPAPVAGAVPVERYDQAPQNSSKGNPSY